MTSTDQAPGQLLVVSGPSRHYDAIVVLFCSLLLIANVAATKLIGFGGSWSIGPVAVLPIITDGGAIVFPLTYVLGDILAEVYGFDRARRAIVSGFAVSILAAVAFMLVDLAPPAPGWPNDAAWHAVLGFVPRIVAASLVGYIVGQILNARVVTAMRDRARPGSLWWRLLSSTLVGQVADTTLFCVIAFAGVVPVATLLNYIVFGYVYKVSVEAVLLPVTTRVIGRIRRSEAAFAARQVAP